MINKTELMHFFYSNNFDFNKKRAKELRIKFKEYLKENPFDTEIWIKFALMLYVSCLHEDLSAQECLENVLIYDPNNIQVILLRAYIIEHYSCIDEDLFKILNKLKTPDKSLMSLIEYAKSSYYYLVQENFDEYENCLLRSINFCDKYLSNYVALGQFYIKRGYLTKGYNLLNKGLKNLKYIYDDNHPYDILDIEEFFNERFKGIHITDINYGIILQSFDQNSPWITGDFINKKNNNSTTEN